MPSRTFLDPTSLLGSWVLTRTIEDRLSGEPSTVDGVTGLELLDDGRVRWSESGTLRRGDLVVPVSRTLFVEQRDTGWFVTFEDGRDFHPWLPGDRVVHPCGSDIYVGRVEGGVDRWTVVWEVGGPAKDYRMTSELTRA